MCSKLNTETTEEKIEGLWIGVDRGGGHLGVCRVLFLSLQTESVMQGKKAKEKGGRGKKGFERGEYTAYIGKAGLGTGCRVDSRSLSGLCLPSCITWETCNGALI